MSLSQGTRLGPYEIVSPLGAGGMGEVYRARDVRLDRTVAIKVLPSGFASDPERLRRFEQEARAASSLHHPNIVTVYDVGEADSLSYIAIEFIEGETLRELLPRALPTRRLLEIAVQIADGLASAHEAGIVHRDLKPGNVMVSRDGFVKILDFGLAKLSAPAASPDQSRSPTVAAPETRPGQILGTVDYMSPEQAIGESLDFRSDQFSLGSVLYEMATGRRAFSRKTSIDTLSAILNDDPEPIAQLRPDVPAPLRWLIERCLSKSPGNRYASTRDLATELRGLKDHFSEISSAFPSMAGRPRPPRSASRIAIGVALLAVAGASWMALSGRFGSPPDPGFRRLTFRNGVVSRALFVPSSNSILYTASWDGQPSRSYLTLPESKGVDRSLEAEPQLPMAYSEDGAEVLVLLGQTRSAINPRGTLAWWPALGGKARTILSGAGWSDWARKGHFFAVVREEGTERVLEVWDESVRRQRTLFRTPGAISFVRISPDEKRVAFIHHPSRTDDAGEVRVASVDGTASRAVSARFERCVGLAWNRRTNEIWFTATLDNIYNTTLWAADPARAPHRVYSFADFFLLQDVGEAGCLFVASSGGTDLLLRRGSGTPGNFSWLGSTWVADVSADGKSVLFLDGSTTGGTLGMWVRPLDGGEAIRIADGDPGKFSPDGHWVVGTTRPVSGPPQILLVSTTGGQARQLTRTAASYSDPSFADPGTLLFVRSEGNRREVWRMATDGTGARALGATGCDSPVASPSGIAFLCVGGTHGNELLVYAMSGDGRARRLRELPPGSTFLYARWNDAGKAIVAVSSERHLLTLDPSTGTVLHEEEIPLREGAGSDSLLAAAVSPSADLQAYSISHFSSRLYLSRSF